MHISYSLALDVMDWHGGQFTPTYALASSAHAGYSVTKEMIEEAISELEHEYRKLNHRTKIARELRALIHRLHAACLYGDEVE